MLTKLFRILAISLCALSVSGSVAFAQTWTPPTALPPNGNVDEPVNIGTDSQTKSGGFGALWAAFVDLLVTGSIQGTDAVTGFATDLILNPDGGNVGIGTTNPLSKLHVAGGDIRIDQPYSLIFANGQNIRDNGAGGLSLAVPTGGAAINLATTNGNITLSPGSGNVEIAGKVKIVDGSQAAGRVLTSDASGLASWATLPVLSETDPTVPASVKDGTSWSEISSIPAGFADGVDNDTTYSSGTGLSLAGTTFSLNTANANTWTGAQRFSANTYFPGFGIWNTSGNVGVGTVGPVSKLHVYQDSDVWHTRIGGGSGELRIGGQNPNGAVIQSSTPAGAVRNLLLQTNGGNVAIGTTNPGTNKLYVNGNAYVNGYVSGGVYGGTDGAVASEYMSPNWYTTSGCSVSYQTMGYHYIPYFSGQTSWGVGTTPNIANAYYKLLGTGPCTYSKTFALAQCSAGFTVRKVTGGSTICIRL